MNSTSHLHLMPSIIINVALPPLHQIHHKLPCPDFTVQQIQSITFSVSNIPLLQYLSLFTVTTNSLVNSFIYTATGFDPYLGSPSAHNFVTSVPLLLFAIFVVPVRTV